jgi:hypothetical protein
LLLHPSNSVQESRECGAEPSGSSEVGKFLILQLLYSLDLFSFIMGNINHKGGNIGTVLL